MRNRIAAAVTAVYPHETCGLLIGRQGAGAVDAGPREGLADYPGRIGAAQVGVRSEPVNGSRHQEQTLWLTEGSLLSHPCALCG